MASMFSKSSAPLTMVRAWTYLGVNLLATPGLGSLWGGRRLAGSGQLLFSLTGFCLIVMWIFKLSLANMEAQINETDAIPVPAWWWHAGGGAFGISWVWSLVTSISLVMEASRNVGAVLLPLPPKLAGAAKPRPPTLSAPLVSPSKSRPLDSFQISAALGSVPAWQRQGPSISRRYQFQDFSTAITFVNQVAELSEEAGHHPDIDIRWNVVTLALSTHDVGGLTEKDFALARAFDCLV